MKGHGSKTFGRLNADRYDALHDLQLDDPGSAGPLLQERRAAPQRQGSVRRGDGRA